MNTKNNMFSNRMSDAIFPLIICSLFKLLPAGDYIGDLEYYYFTRQPSARAEAMGRSSVASESEAFSCLYNPALISLNKGLCLSGSYASPYGLLEDAVFSFLGITYTTEDYGSFGIGRYEFDDGFEGIATDENGNIIGSFESTEYIYTLTYAYQFPLNYIIGINLSNYYHKQSIPLMVGSETNDGISTAFPVDVGILKRIPIDEDKDISHQITFGASLFNILGTTIKGSDRSDPLPQIFHLGVAYKLQLGQLTPQKLRPYQLYTQIEYQDVFNSDFYTGFKLGGEVALYEMLYFRLGYYTQTQNDYGIPGNRDSIEDFTYGFGLVMPINALFGFKFIENIKFDMLVLDQDADNSPFGEIKDYSNYNLTINFNL